MKDNSRNLQVLHNKLKEFREKMLKIKKKKKKTVDTYGFGKEKLMLMSIIPIGKIWLFKRYH